jgi:organic hydroperoxide reductase OsmC/OhrA
MEKTEKLHHKNESNDLQNNLNGVLYALDLKKENSFSIEAATNREESCEEIKEGGSPEHLFEAALCGCLKTAFLAIAKNSLLEYTSFNCTAKGTSEMNSGESIITEILLKATIEIHDELSRNKAMRIFIKAEDTCLIAHSVRSKITLEIFIHVRPILNISKSNLNLGNSLLNW